MTTDRLTRQELSWLLAQEARAAATMLRKGVSGLKIKIEEAPVVTEVSSTLDALDDAVKTLATLQTGGPIHNRRGRIDVAALLLELAPHAAINLEPGSGTEVVSDEAELRRMLQVLLSLGAPAGEGGASIGVRRHGETIRVEVALGPDSSGASSMEQAWLHRMAVRHGGQLALEGNTMALGLPAGGEQREVEELRRELAAAQEQGEMYAREIAAMFTQKGQSEAPPSQTPGGPTLASFCGALAAQLRPDIQAIREGEGETGHRAQALLTAVDTLDRFARVDRAAADLGRLVTDAINAHLPRAERRGVALSASQPPQPERVPQAAALLLDLLLEQAVEASPAGQPVQLSAQRDGDSVALQIDDGGAAVPPRSRRPLLSFEADGPSLGRPRGVHLGLAAALAASLGATLTLDDAPQGGLRVRVVF